MLLADTANGDIENGDPKSDLILGIISMGNKCEKDMRNGSIHTRMLDFLPWIDKIRASVNSEMMIVLVDPSDFCL